MLPRLLPLIAGLLPLVAMLGALVIGIAYEALPPCNPFIDGCISISAAGRKPPGSYLFRMLMLPQSVVLLFLWYFAVEWLAALDENLRARTRMAIYVLGVIGAVALAVYVTFLGTKEPIYEFMRRIGIYFGFAGTGFAQLLISLSLVRIARAAPQLGIGTHARTLLSLAAVLFGLGLLVAVLKPMLVDPDPLENRVEWLSALVMQAHFVVLWLTWRATGFQAPVEVQS